MSETTAKITIELDYPITDGEGKEIKKLEMRRAKAKDLRKMQMQKNEADQEVFLFANLTDLTLEDIDELDICDYQKVQTAFKGMTKGKSAQNT
ncbi:phage tail assembly protein [Pasteurella skyensis]|uniref:Phage tail assembly protein n=1 Tax=Phocoenobacter skyensis TaxID=97481 RepID=A0AAJ6P0G0_9PAST|nr:phage tail assembly protein [Pasteurella skyensis]MDP8172609.1 phage tail assembly protein [Pasteurella skyensis]MDP8179109.1 phage tail assembly protein [Pasteurella skyensis]MDP8183206.1 phage tail assembly protein [Pasteurella skyensis]MDP8189257.1 phage tail assembly protein [Pasteurella skyensis]